jgi:hypothetical protein
MPKANSWGPAGAKTMLYALFLPQHPGMLYIQHTFLNFLCIESLMLKEDCSKTKAMTGMYSEAPGIGAEQKRYSVFIYGVWGFAPNSIPRNKWRFCWSG